MEGPTDGSEVFVNVSPHLAEIQDIESISKPQLPGEIYTICQNLSLEEYRKEYSTGSTQNLLTRQLIKGSFA